MIRALILITTYFLTILVAGHGVMTSGILPVMANLKPVGMNTAAGWLGVALVGLELSR